MLDEKAEAGVLVVMTEVGVLVVMTEAQAGETERQELLVLEIGDELTQELVLLQVLDELTEVLLEVQQVWVCSVPEVSSRGRGRREV